MIALSLNFDGLTGKTERNSHEKKVREIVATHFGFPGSDKLKMGVTIKDNGSSSVIFAGPQDIVSEAKRLWAENVAPAANRVKAAASNVATSIKKQKPKLTVAPKKKKVSVTVKASASKKASAKKAPAKKTAAKKKK